MKAEKERLEAVVKFKDVWLRIGAEKKLEKRTWFHIQRCAVMTDLNETEYPSYQRRALAVKNLADSLLQSLPDTHPHYGHIAEIRDEFLKLLPTRRTNP